jgi:hypothetical protein
MLTVTGWRTPSEILPLEWRQVDLKAGEVRGYVVIRRTSAVPAQLVQTVGVLVLARVRPIAVHLPPTIVL